MKVKHVFGCELARAHNLDAKLSCWVLYGAMEDIVIVETEDVTIVFDPIEDERVFVLTTNQCRWVDPLRVTKMQEYVAFYFDQDFWSDVRSVERLEAMDPFLYPMLLLNTVSYPEIYVRVRALQALV